MKKSSILLIVLFCTFSFAQVSPFAGLGNAQWFDNNGNVLTSGVLYSYQAGTSSQQATYTDGTGTVQNPNPITFTTGARAAIWLNSGAFYKFVLCLQNDGSSCASADVLFSADQVPGSPAGSSSGGSGPPFISGSANPATGGILRLASADSICWRNQANSANLCVSKDSNDVLAWASALKLQEINCINSGTGFDFLCADSGVHRLKMAGNGGTQVVIAAQGADINTLDRVTQWHFGSTPTPLNTTAPTSGQFLAWDGTHISGLAVATEATFSNAFVSPNNGINDNCGTASAQCAETVFVNAHNLIRFTFQNMVTPLGCGASLIIGVVDMTASSNLYTSTIANSQAVGFVDSGALSVAIPAGHNIGIGVTQTQTLCSPVPTAWALTMVYQ